MNVGSLLVCVLCIAVNGSQIMKYLKLYNHEISRYRSGLLTFSGWSYFAFGMFLIDPFQLTFGRGRVGGRYFALTWPLTGVIHLNFHNPP